MLRLLAVVVLLANFCWPSLAFAEDVYVNGYYKSNGTYVQPYYRTAPDSNPYNNYSTQGNINPYTGETGTKNVYPSDSYSSYGSGTYGSGNSLEPLGSGGSLNGSGGTCLLCN